MSRFDFRFLLKPTQVTFIVLLLLFFQLPARAQEDSLCGETLQTPELRETCLAYENDERFDLFLTLDRIAQCEDLYGEWPRTFRMCLRATSRNQDATTDKVRACHRNFYYTYDMRNCLKFAALLSVQQINECGDTHIDRFRPLKGMQCISDKVGVWRLDYEDRMFSD